MKKNRRVYNLPMDDGQFEYTSDEERKFAEEMDDEDGCNITNIIDDEELDKYLERHS